MKERSVSVPRVVVAGLEGGPAFELVAGAIVAGLGKRRPVRPILLGLDTALWRLLYDSPGKAPRVLDPALHTAAVGAELFEYWTENVESAVLVGARPILDRWEGVEGSRPLDFAQRFDAPVVLVLDARERGATAAAAVVGACSLSRGAEVGGVVVVGLDDTPAGRDLSAALKRDLDVPILGQVPPQLSEQFARHAAVVTGAVRTIGPRPPADAGARLCEEAAGYLRMDALETIASRRGFVPAVQRRLLGRDIVATFCDRAVAVAWGPPLRPLALENIDVLQAAGVQLKPLNIARDRVLPEGVSGLLLAGQLDESLLDAFSANRALMAQIARAVEQGLPTLALGGGALLLLRRLSDSRGRSHDLVGAIPGEAELLEWYRRPRYVPVVATGRNPYDEGENLLYELFDLEYLVLEQESFAYRVRSDGGAEQAEGFATARCLATTLYPSFALCPRVAERFITALRAADVWE